MEVTPNHVETALGSATSFKVFWKFGGQSYVLAFGSELLTQFGRQGFWPRRKGEGPTSLPAQKNQPQGCTGACKSPQAPWLGLFLAGDLPQSHLLVISLPHSCLDEVLSGP